jgi:hypothetical protein
MFTFCNSYVLWLLRCVKLRLVTVTFCDINVVWCYVLSQYRNIPLAGTGVSPVYRVGMGNDAHNRQCRVDVSPTNVSLTENSWILQPSYYLSLGLIIPDRCVPSLDRMEELVITPWLASDSSLHPGHRSLRSLCLLDWLVPLRRVQARHKHYNSELPVSLCSAGDGLVRGTITKGLFVLGAQHYKHIKIRKKFSALSLKIPLLMMENSLCS